MGGDAPFCIEGFTGDAPSPCVGRPSPGGAIGRNPGIPAPAGLKVVVPSLAVDGISDYTVSDNVDGVKHSL